MAESSPLGPRIQLASLPGGASIVLPHLALSGVPKRIISTSEQAFTGAEVYRIANNAPGAVCAYLQLIERYPDSPQAQTAYQRIRRIVTSQTPEGLQAIEAALPQSADVSTVNGMATIGIVYVARAKLLMKTSPKEFAAYLPKAYDLSWRILQQNPEDQVGKTAVEVILIAGDAMGQGPATRAKLSAYADSLAPCFTSWLIQTLGNKAEPPFEFVPTYDGRNMVCSYYLNTAKDTKDPLTRAVYFTKARDASLKLMISLPPDKPVFDHCHNYLIAAEALGVDARNEAIAKVGALLESQPPSISRWVMRFDRAEFLTREGSSPEDAHTGYLDFEALVNEADQKMIDQAVNDGTVDGRARGLLVCVLGHGYSGTNRLAEAETCYQWVVDNFPNEIHPEETAAYSLAVMEDRKNANSPRVGAVAYEQFLTTHPSGAYSADALLHEGESYLRANDTADAAVAFQRAAQEFSEDPDTLAKAVKSLAQISPSS
jgi:tetratricopeptide (TPR) repeat protein